MKTIVGFLVGFFSPVLAIVLLQLLQPSHNYLTDDMAAGIVLMGLITGGVLAHAVGNK